MRRFDRVRSTVVDGLFQSVFEVQFPAKELRSLDPLPIRFDTFHRSAAWPFRMRPSTLPKTRVVRINDRVQYSSHVVNIVVPSDWRDEFAPGVPPGDRFANVQEAIKIFDDHFEGIYEDLAFIPTRGHRVPIGLRISIHLDVEGVGLPTGSARELWGGSDILRGLQIHVRGDFLWNGHIVHETGHQWGFNFDLFDLAGIEPLVSTECKGDAGHPPLVAPLHSYMRDSCLPEDDRDRGLCIRRDENGGWVLAPCELPLGYHPFQLYAMGLLEPADVPPLFLRQRQDRPEPYRAGTPVEGPFLEITIDDVIDRYGERQGPAMASVWRRAHIVLSPDRLLSPKDLAWFNFFAKRVSDPDVTGIEGTDRSPSLEFATRGRVDLRTEIRPLAGPPIDGLFAVSYPKIGKKDFAGVKLEEAFGTRYRVGETYVISGKISAPGVSKKVKISIGSQSFKTGIKDSGRFTIKLKPKARNRGPQVMTLALANPKVVLGQVAPVCVE